MKNILIADDNNQIIEVLKQYALKENYTVFTADNGSKTLEEFHKRDYDVILLDVMMPEIDGFEVCRRIRQTSMVPIIMITARGEDYDKIMGLDIGADDYVIKPFSPSEVMARVRAILRRVESIGISNKEVVQKGSLRINLDKFQVFIHDETVSLTKKEVEILWLLASNAGIVFSRTQILDSVWGFEYFGDSRTIDTHIKRLRSKVDTYEHSDWKILTVRGIGYKFEVIHEITKKLFFYFSIISAVLAATVFVGFYGIFRYYSYQHHERELQLRAELIKEKLEDYISDCTANQELSAYLKVLDDISLADAYFISRDGQEFTCSCTCNTTVKIEKKPTQEVETFAEKIFKCGEYTQIKKKDKRNNTVIYVGIPVKEQGETTAVVVMRDTFDMDQGSFLIAIIVLLLCLLFALLLSLFLSGIMARHFMVPIQKIAMATAELANGNYQIKTDVYDKNEIGELAKKTDILAQKLDAANKERERMKQMQRDYIANISHELRTPVTVIRSSIEALNDGMIPEDKVKEYQKQMLVETISLQRLINDMLDLSRLENEDFPIEMEALDLGFVLEDAVRSIRMIARQKDINVNYRSVEEEWPFKGDYGRLRQMFLTVLENAVKYSDEGKEIWIETTKKVDAYYISIKDEGCGISKESLPFIFNKFYRSSRGQTEGTGLGMAIAKSIADRHDISIRIHSVEGEGSKVTFIVPVNK